MAGRMRVFWLAGLVLLGSAAGTRAFGWFYGGRTTTSYSAYATPVRVIYCPIYVPVYCQPAALPGPRYAVPRPAPPSQTSPSQQPMTNEPPLLKPAPKITESHSLKTDGAPADPGQVRLGFWNITGRDVTVVVDGQPHAVARNRALMLTVGRDFLWQMDQGPTRRERVPDGKNELDIVLRP
jgi:hypothetical protein